MSFFIPKFRLSEISDLYLREIFRQIQSYFWKNTNLVGFNHVEIAFTSAVSNYKYPHGLGFLPKDVIVTSLVGSGTITWNYDLFTATDLDLTVTGACTVRAYIGTHVEGLS